MDDAEVVQGGPGARRDLNLTVEPDPFGPTKTESPRWSNPPAPRRRRGWARDPRPGAFAIVLFGVEHPAAPAPRHSRQGWAKVA